MGRKALIFILAALAMFATVSVAGMTPVSAQTASPPKVKTWSITWPSYQFHYYASYVESGIPITADSQYWKCNSYGFQRIHRVGGSFSARFDGPTQAWLNGLESYEAWCPILTIQPGTFLLVYEDATPAAGQCFPPDGSFYGIITEDNRFLSKSGQPTYFRSGHWYYTTTCAFHTLYPHRPIKPPAFSISYGWSEEKIVEGDANVSAWNYRKFIDEIPPVFPGGTDCVKEFHVVYNQTTYPDVDKDGIINPPGFTVWIENASRQVDRYCDSTIYASGWLRPVRLPDWWPYKTR